MTERRRVPPLLIALLVVASLAAAGSIVAFVVVMNERQPARIPDAGHHGFGAEGPVLHMPDGIAYTTDTATRTVTFTGLVDAHTEARARDHVRLNLLRSDWKVVWAVEIGDAPPRTGSASASPPAP